MKIFPYDQVLVSGKEYHIQSEPNENIKSQYYPHMLYKVGDNQYKYNLSIKQTGFDVLVSTTPNSQEYHLVKIETPQIYTHKIYKDKQCLDEVVPVSTRGVYYIKFFLQNTNKEPFVVESLGVSRSQHSDSISVDSIDKDYQYIIVRVSNLTLYNTSEFDLTILYKFNYNPRISLSYTCTLTFTDIESTHICKYVPKVLFTDVLYSLDVDKIVVKDFQKSLAPRNFLIKEADNLPMRQIVSIQKSEDNLNFRASCEVIFSKSKIQILDDFDFPILDDSTVFKTEFVEYKFTGNSIQNNISKVDRITVDRYKPFFYSPKKNIILYKKKYYTAKINDEEILFRKRSLHKNTNFAVLYNDNKIEIITGSDIYKLTVNHLFEYFEPKNVYNMSKFVPLVFRTKRFQHYYYYLTLYEYKECSSSYFYVLPEKPVNIYVTDKQGVSEKLIIEFSDKCISFPNVSRYVASGMLIKKIGELSVEYIPDFFRKWSVLDV